MSVPGRTKQKASWWSVPTKTIPRVTPSVPSVWRLSSGCIEMKWARCVWGSIPPGTTSFPVASSTRPASTRGSGRPTATMRSPWTATSHRPTPCSVTTSPPRITRSSMVPPPSLHLGRGLPPDEPRVDLLEELRVEDTLGSDLLGDPVERVEEVDELAHAAVDLVGHLHRVDVEGHDVAREPFVHLHLTRHDLHGGLAVGVDRGRRLRERAQHRLQGVRVLLEHLAARDDPRVHEEPVDLTLLARDVAPVPGEVDLSPRALDGVEHPRRPARHRVDVPLGERGDPVGRREVHELDLGEVHAGILRHRLDGHGDGRALRHADLQLLEVLGRPHDLLSALAEDDLLRARDVALGGDVVDRLPGRRDRHDHRRRRRTEMDVPGAPHRRQVGPGDVPARTDLDPLLLEVAQRVGHGELRRHLRVPHEPRIHLAELRPLRERTARLPEDEKRRQHHRQLSHPTAPFGMSGPRQGSARPRSTRRSVISSMASTRRRLAPVPTNIGKNVVYAMKATFDVSPRPNHTRNIGRKASGGIGRTNSMTGSSASRAGVETATSRPRASAAAAASPNPSTMRRADTVRWWASDPSRICTAASAPTSPGVGSSTGVMTSSARLP